MWLPFCDELIGTIRVMALAISRARYARSASSRRWKALGP